MPPRRSWEKAKSPYWSAHVAAWYRGRHEAAAYCRQRKLPTATLVRANVSSSTHHPFRITESLLATLPRAVAAPSRP